MEKFCKRCSTTKSIKKFYKSHSFCKECSKKISTKNQQKQLEKILFLLKDYDFQKLQ
jgi:uncharacterized protein (DUF983 family)